MKKERIKLWVDGQLKVDDLSDKEIRFLEKRVMKAIEHRKRADPTKMTFATHRTMQ